jgi:hypothetical protein
LERRGHYVLAVGDLGDDARYNSGGEVSRSPDYGLRRPLQPGTAIGEDPTGQVLWSGGVSRMRDDEGDVGMYHVFHRTLNERKTRQPRIFNENKEKGNRAVALNLL